MSEPSLNEEPGARDWPGVVGCVLAIGLGAAALAHSGDFSMLGAVFPRTVATLMIVLGVAYTVLTLRGRTRRASQPAGSAARRAGVMLVMLAWAFTLEPLGFLPSSAAAFALLLILANHERWTIRRLLLFPGAGALMLATLYGLFKLVLLVPLP
jgi:putative tricarboxylic transport membrane protein